MSDTPRTDKVAELWWQMRGNRQHSCPTHATFLHPATDWRSGLPDGEWVNAAFTRQLERELADMTKQRDLFFDMISLVDRCGVCDRCCNEDCQIKQVDKSMREMGFERKG